MARDAFGPDIAAAWAQMATPQGAAARLLAPHAHAMTDVTGFGLAGHLLEMLEASACAAVLEAAAIPLLPGAASAATRHASSLAPANRAALAGRADLPDTPLGALLVDPQTAGPLLAAVPAASAPALVGALHAAGFADAAVVGRIVEGAPAVGLAS
jgi:selenide,water dikinase